MAKICETTEEGYMENPGMGWHNDVTRFRPYGGAITYILLF
jgi:hypothetical protein